MYLKYAHTCTMGMYWPATQCRSGTKRKAASESRDLQECKRTLDVGGQKMLCRLTRIRDCARSRRQKMQETQSMGVATYNFNTILNHDDEGVAGNDRPTPIASCTNKQV